MGLWFLWVMDFWVSPLFKLKLYGRNLSCMVGNLNVYIVMLLYMTEMCIYFIFTNTQCSNLL